MFPQPDIKLRDELYEYPTDKEVTFEELLVRQISWMRQQVVNAYSFYAEALEERKKDPGLVKHFPENRPELQHMSITAICNTRVKDVRRGVRNLRVLEAMLADAKAGKLEDKLSDDALADLVQEEAK